MIKLIKRRRRVNGLRLSVVCLFIFFNSLFLVFANVALAQPAQPSEVQLEFIAKKTEIETIERNLRLLRLDKVAIDQEVQKLDRQAEVLVEREKLFADELGGLKQQEGILGDKIVGVMGRVKGDREEFHQQVVSIYKFNRKKLLLDYLFGSSNFENLNRRVQYSNRVLDNNLENLKNLESTLSGFESEKKILEANGAKLQKTLLELDKTSKQIQETKKRKEELLADSKSKEIELQKTVKNLEESTSELSKTLEEMMGGEQIEAQPVLAKRPDPIKLFDLRKLRGKLKWPVEGRVVQKFGKKQHSEFSETLLKKGIEIKAKTRAEVVSIAPGTVVLSQVLPEYGKVIIIDHGKRYYSLYGRIFSPRVFVGDRVRSEQVVAILGDVDKKGRNFYFELRRKGKAVNPELYLSPSS